MNFSDLELRPEILRVVTELGYTEATDIQFGAIPHILAGKDIIGRSGTGTGKTAAFGIPMVQLAAVNEDQASVLILAPTRELAEQIAGELRKYAKYIEGIPLATVYGGQSMEVQIRNLRKAKIVIGTPGRVMDHLRRKTLKLDHLKSLILDEADEMLNMGFVDDIRTILSDAPKERQTLLFSATLSKEIMDITTEFQTEPVVVKVDNGERTVASIDQKYYNIPKETKVNALKLLVEASDPKRALVFCNTKSMVDELTTMLLETGFKAAGIHGDLKQMQRNAVMKEFKSGRCKILVATDVAARGIDVEDIEDVFNFDIPQEREYYIHRIGRTGRAGKTGTSHTLVVNRRQLDALKDLERYIGTPIKEGKVPTLEEVNKNKQNLFADEIKTKVDAGVDEAALKLVRELIAEGYDAEQLAAAFCERVQKKNSRLNGVENVRSVGKGHEAGSYGKRNSDQHRGGERKSYGDRPSFGKKKPYGDRPSFGEKKSYGDRPSFGEKKSYGDKPAFGEKKSYGDKPAYGEKKSYGDKPAYGEKKSYGDRPAYGEKKSYGDRPAYGEKKSYGDKPAYGEKKSYGDRPAYGEKKSYGDKPAYGEKKSYGDKPAYGEKKSYGSKPSFGGKKSFGSKSSSGEKKPSGEKRVYID